MRIKHDDQTMREGGLKFSPPIHFAPYHHSTNPQALCCSTGACSKHSPCPAFSTGACCKHSPCPAFSTGACSKHSPCPALWQLSCLSLTYAIFPELRFSIQLTCSVCHFSTGISGVPCCSPHPPELDKTVILESHVVLQEQNLKERAKGGLPKQVHLGLIPYSQRGSTVYF